MLSARLQIPHCPPEAIAALRRELGVGDALAQALVRRGFGEPQQARALLDGGESHAPEAFDGIEAAIEPILRHVAQRRRITVHGDYDVDGVCATALLVRALRRLGGEVDWHIPDRVAGYGLREGAVRAIAQRGSGLLVTVDCGITAVQEVALAHRLGLEVVITDHHAPRADGALPQAPIVHPTLCGYPCPHLCGTAVAYKLAQALRSASGHAPRQSGKAGPTVGDARRLASGADGLGAEDADLDLVALASVADVVELTCENRTLVRAGLRALSATTRPGLRALIEVARIDPCRLDTRAVGFGLAPRLNAPGRLYTAAPALELLMTEDPSRAAELAAALERCNGERRHVEQRILFEAEAQLRQLGEMPAYVLAGEGWHPGVVGIVASRIAERVNRPTVLVALDGDAGRGSGRSIPGFDLLAGLRACEEHLAAYGGHRAACGLEIERRRLDAFRAAFAEHAAQTLGESDLTPLERVDAVVSVRDLGLPLAEELERLAPFGRGNPKARLLIRDARIGQVRAMGQGRHARFRVFGEGAHASAVCFGAGARLPVGEGEAVDATFTLEVNEWRGVSEPRLVLRRMRVGGARVGGAQIQARPERPPDADLPPGAERPSTREPQPLQLALAVP